jgi:hypothetical protein
MKKNDFLVILIVFAVLSPFFLFKSVYDAYNHLNSSHGILMSFLKFAILATFGESIALRIKSGVYNEKGFGLIPRAIVWGFLGITIKMAMVVFATGTPAFLKYLGFQNPEIHPGNLGIQSIFVAFSISTAMNLIYAPVMMTFHKITDIHILTNGGTIKGLLKPIPFGLIFKQIDWDRQWNFVFKKTIPFFWIPAHTITFLLPIDFQVLFAALLGVALGVILSFSSK